MTKNRIKPIAFRANEKERQILEIMAARENRDLSEMMRELIREGAARRGLYAVGMTALLSRYEVKGAENDK